MNLWGIDLGGTKIEGVVIDPSRPDCAVVRLRVPTEQQLGYDHIVAQVAKLVGLLETASSSRRPATIGIGTPGTIDPLTQVLKNSNTTCLNGRKLGIDLSATLGVDACLANDANCFALAEAKIGAARDRSVVFGVILGTGVGGGVVVNGHIIGGVHGIAGEWGHNPMRGEHEPCYCGRSGCVETVISGPALERYYGRQSGQSIELREIVRRAGDADAAALATLSRLQQKFAEAVAAVINILDPDAIVLGGGVGNLDILYTEATRQAVLRHLFNNELHTELLKPALGDSAGVFGAAMLGLQ